MGAEETQMLHELTSDQDMLRDTTARYLGDRAPLSKLRKDRDHPAGFDPDYWQQGVELGWTMLLVGEDSGGGSVSGNGAVDLSLIAYEFGKHAAPGPLVDCNVVAAALSGLEGDLQQAVLQELLTGSGIATSCLGAAPWMNPADAAITIRRDGDDVLIDGSVRPVESGAQASHFLVTGQSEAGMTQVLVPASAAGSNRSRPSTSRGASHESISPGSARRPARWSGHSAGPKRRSRGRSRMRR
jgi:alkylation response protein AidB-like acyl-CoA dehydrogenase